jgi:hypothetical protein
MFAAISAPVMFKGAGHLQIGGQINAFGSQK